MADGGSANYADVTLFEPPRTDAEWDTFLQRYVVELACSVIGLGVDGTILATRTTGLSRMKGRDRTTRIRTILCCSRNRPSQARAALRLKRRRVSGHKQKRGSV